MSKLIINTKFWSHCRNVASRSSVGSPNYTMLKGAITEITKSRKKFYSSLLTKKDMAEHRKKARARFVARATRYYGEEALYGKFFLKFLVHVFEFFQ